jgi:hypothetical protein
MHYLPDVVSAPEASDEVDPLRRALCRKTRSVEDVDDDCSLPHTNAARVFRLRPTLLVGDREHRSSDLRTARLLPVSERGGCCSADRVHVREGQESARIALDAGLTACAYGRSSGCDRIRTDGQHSRRESGSDQEVSTHRVSFRFAILAAPIVLSPHDPARRTFSNTHCQSRRVVASGREERLGRRRLTRFRMSSREWSDFPVLCRRRRRPRPSSVT